MEATITTTVQVPDDFKTEIGPVLIQRLLDAFVARCRNDADIAEEVMHNFPECGICVRCVGWHYMDKDEKNLPHDQMYLVFDHDCELDDKDYIIPSHMVEGYRIPVHKVTHQDVVQALPAFRQAVDTHKFNQDGVSADDPETWDGIVYDAIIQLALLGEILLG